MSRTRQDGHGRCCVCGDAGANRRAREAAWHRADDAAPVERVETSQCDDCDGCSACDPDFGEGDDWELSPSTPRLVVPLALILAACSLSHLDPQPRSVTDANAATVRVTVFCEEDDPAPTSDPTQPQPFPPIEWVPPGVGTGCLVSDRYVVTAAHVVRCPVIPLVHVRLRDGRLLRFSVDRDDAMFPRDSAHPTDVARLVLASAGGVGLGVVPPIIGHAHGGEEAIAAIARAYPTPHGTIDTADPTIVWGMITIPGDSGACIDDRAGELLGVDSKSATCTDGTSCATRFAPVPSEYLEGT